MGKGKQPKTDKRVDALVWESPMSIESRIALVKDVLEHAKGNRTHAAKALGISRQWLARFIAEHAGALGLSDSLSCPHCGGVITLRRQGRGGSPPSRAA